MDTTHVPSADAGEEVPASPQGRRSWLIGAAAAVALVGAAAVAVIALTGATGDTERHVLTAPKSTGGTEASLPTSTTLLGAPAPARTVVALVEEDLGTAPEAGPRRQQRVVVADATTGVELRELYRPGDGHRVSGVGLSVDGRGVYLGDLALVQEGSCSPRLIRISVDGGPPEIAADGVQPAMSPDGRFLAYVADGRIRAGLPNGSNCGLQAVVVRDLRDASERVFLPGGSVDKLPLSTLGGVGGIVWSPDSKQLAFGVYYEDSYSYVVALDSGAVHQVLAQGALAGALERRYFDDVGPLFSSPAWTPEGDLLSWIGCYACLKSSLTGFAPRGEAVTELSAPPHVVDPAELVPHATALARAPADTFVRKPETYVLDVPAVAPSDSLALEDGALVARSASGERRIVFRGVRALTALIVPTGHFTYVEEQAPAGSCVPLVWQLPLGGGIAVPVSDGSLVTPSPDGRRIAMQATVGSPCTSAGLRIVGADPVDDQRLVLAVPGAGPQGSISAFVWSPSSQQVAVAASTSRGRRGVYLWTASRYGVALVSVGTAAPNPFGGPESLSDPVLDAAFGAGQWDIVDPTFDGSTLHARVVCTASATSCHPDRDYVLTGGEDGVFDPPTR